MTAMTSAPAITAARTITPVRKKVGVLRHYFLPPSETFIYQSMVSLDRYQARVFAMERRSEQKFPWLDVTALRALPLGQLEALLYRVTTYSPRFFAWARENALIHAHIGYTGVHALAACARYGLPLVTSFYGRDVTLHDSPERRHPMHWHYWALRRLLFARGTRFVVLSQEMRGAMINAGCPAERLRVVPLGIDLQRFSVPPARRRARARVLMVGRETEKKGFDDGLRACARAKAEGADLEVVLLGTGGPLLPELQRLAASLDLDVSWPDPSSSVAAAMAEADIMLVPSRTASDGDKEGTPTVIFEAAASGLAVVSTRHAGIPEQVVDGETGLLAAERDVETLARHLLRLSASPEERRALGQAGRQRMEREFSVEAHRDKLQAVYDEVVGLA